MKKRKKRSIIWLTPLDDFKTIISESSSYREALRYFGFQPKGGNLKTLKERIAEDKIDDSHIKEASKTLNAQIASKIPNEQLFVENSLHSRSAVKKRVVTDDLVSHKFCSICGMSREWENQPINFVLDHINGISNDHRLENLRFLCPNCNSQTSTFAGRNNLRATEGRECPTCHMAKRKNSKTCVKCSGVKRRKCKIRPSVEQLKNDLETMSMVAAGKKYNVSDNTIRKWIKL